MRMKQIFRKHVATDIGQSTGLSGNRSRVSLESFDTRSKDESNEMDQTRVDTAENDTDDEKEEDPGEKNEHAEDENTEDPTENDMWAEAETRLREDAEKRQKLDEYNRILEERFGESLKPIGTAARRKQFQLFFEKEMAEHAAKERADADGSYKKAGRIIKAAAKAIVASKDIIQPATNACLPAGVACTGFVVVVSFCLRASQQRELLYDSLDEIAGSVCRISEYEILCRREPAETRQGITEFDETKAAFVQACSNILEFQARVLCYLNEKAPKRVVRDLFDWDSWSGLLKKIREAEDRILRCAQRHDMAKTLAIYSTLNTLTSELQRQNKEQNGHHFDVRANRFLARLYENTCRYRETKERNQKHVFGTCKWFTNHALFTGWRAGTGTSNVLYVTADPGCGKSVLSAYLVDGVLSGGSEAVCYFFFKDDFTDQKTATSALCALLHQLFDQHRALLTPDILNEYEARGETIVKSVTDLWSLLVRAARMLNIVCVIDALDECYEEDMQQLLGAITRNTTPGLKFLLTSRPYAYIRQSIISSRPYSHDKDSASHVHLQGDNEESASEIAKEITFVINARVEHMATIFDLDADERQLMHDQLLSVKNRTYLWVALVFDGLLEKKDGVTKADILAITKQLPKGIDAAYERIIRRSQDKEQTRRLLLLVLGAKRPLTLAEMADALDFSGPAQQPREEVCDRVVLETRTKKRIRNLCGMFVTVVDNRVYLLHQTAREFLLYKKPTPAAEEETKVRAPDPERLGRVANTTWASHAWTLLLALFLSVVQPILHRLWLFMTDSWQHSMDLTAANEALATACMAYLLSEWSRKEPRWLFDYTAKHWPEHYRESGSRFRAKMGTAARNLCVDSPSNKEWLGQASGNITYVANTHDGLCLASYLGLDGAVSVFLCEICSSTHASAVSKISETQGTWAAPALSLAADRGHASVVRLLLRTGKAKVDAKGDAGRPPISNAARNGYKDVVHLLLEKKAQVDAEDSDGRTPLSHAVEFGHTDVIRLLLEKNAQVNTKDKDGRTPLYYAANNGFKDVIQLLLEKKADINAADTEGGTPLIYAAGNGEKDVVQLLLEKKADIDAADTDGWTPLIYAASNAEKDVVQLLLKWNAQVDAKDNDGRTPLSHAAEDGEKVVMQLLLEGNAQVDVEDDDGWTPLHYAVQDGQKDIVQLLLKWNAQVDAKDNDGRTPLVLAVKNQGARITKMLLDTGKVDATDRPFLEAMEAAKETGNPVICNLLSAYAADGSARNSSLSDSDESDDE